MDTDGAAADFPTVEDHVVGLGVGMFRIGDEEVLMTVERAGERMVQATQRWSSSEYSNIGKLMTQSGCQPGVKRPCDLPNSE